MKNELEPKQKAKTPDEEESKQNDAAQYRRQIEHMNEIQSVKQAMNEEHKVQVLEL